MSPVPSPLALEIAAELDVDPRTVELVLQGTPAKRRSRKRERIVEAIRRRAAG